MKKTAIELSLNDVVYYVNLSDGVRFFNPKGINLDHKQDTITFSDGFKDVIFRADKSLKASSEIYHETMKLHFYTNQLQACEKYNELLNDEILLLNDRLKVLNKKISLNADKIELLITNESK
jgi:hypothetical protein